MRPGPEALRLRINDELVHRRHARAQICGMNRMGIYKVGGRCVESDSVQERSPGRTLKWLGVISAIGMFIVNFIGFLDTQTGSAEGCGPDWPLCNGQVIPALNNAHVIIEFLHRALVGGFALVATVFCVWAFVKYRPWMEVRVNALLGVGFIFIQSILGALAVVFVNPPEVLALHLGFGLMSMVGVALLAVFLYQLDARQAGRRSGLELRRKDIPRGDRNWIWFTWIYTYAAIYLGSDVAFRGAATACQGWPLCNGKVFPGFGGNVGLVFFHRLAAVGLAVVVSFLLYRLHRMKGERPDLYAGGLWLFAFVIIQIISGAYVILTNVSLNADLLHVSSLMILFTILSYLVMQTLSYRPQTPRKT